MNPETDVYTVTKHFVCVLTFEVIVDRNVEKKMPRKKKVKSGFKFHRKCELERQRGGETSWSSSLIFPGERPWRFGMGEHEE